MIRFLSIVFALLLSAPTWADASDFDYLDISYLRYNSPDGDGRSAFASYRFYKDFFTEIGYSRSKLDPMYDLKAEGDARYVGFGFVLDENPTASVSLRAGYVWESAKFEDLLTDEREELDLDGYQVGLLARINTSDRSEFNLNATYYDLDMSDDFSVDGFTYGAQLIFDFTEPVSGVLSARHNNEADSTFYGIGVRINF